MRNREVLLSRIRYYLATQLGWLIVPLSVCLEYINFADRDQPWRGDIFWASDWAGTALFITTPLAAGLAAADTAVISHARRKELTFSVPRSTFEILRPGLLIAGCCCAIHLLYLTAFCIVARSPVFPAFDVAFIWLAQLALFFLLTVLGSLLGLIGGLPWGPLAAIVLTPASVWYLGRDAGPFAPLNAGGSTSSLVGLEINPKFAGAQTVWIAAALAAISWALMSRRSRSRQTVIVPLLPLLLLGLAVPAAHGIDGLERLKMAPTSSKYVCSKDTPRVCLFSQHVRLAAAVKRDLRLIYGSSPAQIRALLPERLYERYPGGATPIGSGSSAFEITPDSFSTDSVPLDLAATDLVTPWRCKQLFSRTPPSDRYFKALQFLTASLTGGKQQWTPDRIRAFTRAHEQVMSCQLFAS